MAICDYPTFLPISLDMRSELHPGLSLLDDGISEYTFAGLYLFRNTYQYQMAWVPNTKQETKRRLIIKGIKEGQTFYAFPCGLPDDLVLRTQMLAEVDYVKGLAGRFADSVRVWSELAGCFVWEDRDNFDYLYLREDLAELSGRKYHKKRNHVNAFINNYQYQEKKFCGESLKEAYSVLETWRVERGQDDDYFASKEGLDLCKELGLCGYMVHADGVPAAYTLGEGLQKGKTFVVHFEKGISSFKGVYQFINMAFAAILPKHYQYINREQDLGNPGLRQSKMTYLPCGFVKKYRIYPKGAQVPVSSASQSDSLIESAQTNDPNLVLVAQG